MRRTLYRLNRTLDQRLPQTRQGAMLLAAGIAVLWWIAALLLRSTNLIPVWYDQGATFLVVGRSLADPYQVPGFVNPPFTAVLLAPLSILPLEVAVLVQLVAYYVLLAALVFKFGGRSKIVLLALLSYIALDAAIQMNIDWLVCIGLLVPAAWSGPFLATKPQLAFGYWLSLKRPDFVRAVIVLLALILVTFVLWDDWPLRMLDAIRANSLQRPVNIAPFALLPSPLISLAIGAVLSWFAFKRHDAILGILAWLFFVPYLTLYSLLLHFALAAVRWPRAALLISVVMWIIYGGAIAVGLVIKLSG